MVVGGGRRRGLSVGINSTGGGIALHYAPDVVSGICGTRAPARESTSARETKYRTFTSEIQMGSVISLAAENKISGCPSWGTARTSSASATRVHRQAF